MADLGGGRRWGQGRNGWSRLCVCSWLCSPCLGLGSTKLQPSKGTGCAWLGAAEISLLWFNILLPDLHGDQKLVSSPVPDARVEGRQWPCCWSLHRVLGTSGVVKRIPTAWGAGPAGQQAAHTPQLLTVPPKPDGEGQEICV